MLEILYRRGANCHLSYNLFVKRNAAAAIALKLVGVTGTVLLIVGFYRRVVHVNPTTVALTFLLGVLIVSALWGLRYAVFMSVAATLAFNFFFLPPGTTFTIADPQNWVALGSFLSTAVIASHLSERVRDQ